MKVLVLFSHDSAELVEQVKSAEAPKERLYGLYELLKDDSVDIEFLDSRFRGVSGRVVNFLKRYQFNPVDYSVLSKIRSADVVVVKDNFSLFLSWFCKCIGTPIIYYDSMFQYPRHAFRAKAFKYCINNSYTTLTYSNTQIELWSAKMGLNSNRFTLIDYTIDAPFYLNLKKSQGSNERLLAIGRDPGRDYATLCAAMGKLTNGVELDLVTLPYLVPEKSQASKNIDLHERIPYEKLFDMYANSFAVVVPLKSGITYPSGIRAVLEAMVLGKPVICTRTDFLAELFVDGQDLLFVDAGDTDQLVQKIDLLRSDPDLCATLSENANALINNRFEYSLFVSKFRSILESGACQK